MAAGARLVDFFIVGTQKGGTTALHSFLSQHPGVELPGIKEIHHFDDESGVDWDRPDHSRLHSFYDWSRPALRGESTPIYCYWPDAIERIHRYNAEAKLIFALRHPLFRAISHWRMETARQRESLSFADAVSTGGRCRVSEAPNGVHRVYSYIERGHYSHQLERIYRLFPRHNVHVYRTDALWRRPAATLSSIEAFLGLEQLLGRLVQPRYVAPASAPENSLDHSEARCLQGQFEADIVRTAEITGLDLSDWHEGYSEPMRPHSEMPPLTVDLVSRPVRAARA
ncbi:MAG: sulfotransferase [Mesorhizobium sp.]|nr:sulfotransferase [Mesorhizobium sp. M2A.F.Ca.ET.046.03.2.1]RVC70959.1 sulfotransferase [Mesorhizobium sp. M00.F.Ca.ET.038.03.1.1]RWB39876.1 MAG: sulfotransferase [Mesorhizobium sp.]RWE17007.1 MAG: sulfotransferase [Mesorhizobium sp.]RWE95160.1 MAG: sulfotransferase [Mesorhizobium sp.]